MNKITIVNMDIHSRHMYQVSRKAMITLNYLRLW